MAGNHCPEEFRAMPIFEICCKIRRAHVRAVLILTAVGLCTLASSGGTTAGDSTRGITLSRPSCRIPVGKIDDSGANWASIPALPPVTWPGANTNRAIRPRCRVKRDT